MGSPLEMAIARAMCLMDGDVRMLDAAHAVSEVVKAAKADVGADLDAYALRVAEAVIAQARDATCWMCKLENSQGEYQSVAYLGSVNSPAGYQHCDGPHMRRGCAASAIRALDLHAILKGVER